MYDLSKYIFLLLILLFLQAFNSILIAQESTFFIKKGDSLYEKTNFSEAYRYYLEAFKKAEIEKNIKNIVISQRAMGTCYYYQHDKVNALKKFYEYLNSSS